MTKEKRFFEYLLELTKLTGKIIRDYKDFEKHWNPSKLKGITGCFINEEVKDKTTYMVIHRPKIKAHEKIPPTPNEKLREWLDFNIDYENSISTYKSERMYINESGEEIIEKFEDDHKRNQLYQKYIDEWTQWAKNLKKKKQQSRLYNEFFELVSRFEREGESLEFIYGRGVLTWQHPDRKVGLIRSPLITQNLELRLDAEKGIIYAQIIDETINVEREMLSGVNLPNKNKVEKIFNQLKMIDIKEDISDLLTKLVHTIDANGEFKDSDSVITIGDSPIVYDHSVFIFRVKNTRVVRDDLHNILEQISNGHLKVNQAIKSLLGEEADSNYIIENQKNTDESIEFTKNRLFFPLPFNEQQKEIVNRIDRNYGVTVQGPPGTGKTHTIANLVSHFLAEGKRVLITSQKESPLRVLKDKIPKDIQDLCVPVLGGGRDSLQEIEKSINTISEKLGELDTKRLGRDVELNLEYLDESKRKETQYINQLKNFTKKEGTVLLHKGEELFRYDVAKRLSNPEVVYEWILDDLKIDVEFPLNEVEFKELWKLRDSLNNNDLKLHFTTLPEVDIDLMNGKAFKELIQTGESLGENKEINSEQIDRYQLPLNISRIDEIIHELELVQTSESIINDDGYGLVFDDLYAGTIRKERWYNLVHDMEESCKQLFYYYNALVTHKIELNNNELSEVKEDIAIAKDRLVSGKKPNSLFFLLKGKRTKYLFREPILNGKPLDKIEDFEPIEDYIRYQKLKAETARIFNSNMQEINHSSIEMNEERFPHILENNLAELKQVIKIYEVINGLEKELSINALDLYAIKDVNILLKGVRKAKIYLEYKRWQECYQGELEKIKSLGEKNNAHSIMFDLIYAFENEDVKQWSNLLNTLPEMYETRERVFKFYQLLERMNKILPLTKKSLEESVGKALDYPEQYLKSFELRKLRTWLDQTKDINTSKLRKLIENEKIKQRDLIRNIVRDSTWKNQIERITDEEKRALSAWKSFIGRYGQGTGQYARQHLNDARESMKKAQSAIPVWIMPTTQVIENFPITNDKFDVIIFDESSQCDIFSANILLRGKRFIVVGDDQQISPQAIGVRQDSVNELVSRYLSDIPNANLFDGNISLYELAEQTFPKEGKLMLREHFRCVPEIIQFSNDLSYGGEMIPLRLPLEEEKLEPPVMAVYIDDGYNDEKDKDVNYPEAEAIVNDIYKLVDDPKYEDQTIGVISLQGNRQQRLLENLIRDKIGDTEFVARKIICGNPYDLQGDERDIVFLSMVVAKNRRFRALVMQREKQRYNVAASRARNQMRLYHSVDTNDLSNRDYRYALLSYCKNPTRVQEELEDLEHMCESPFEVDVLRMILAKGYRVTPQVKVGGYRIDLVVEGVHERLAVECDGERWHGPEKFEEDMLRQESLERSGWKFWRIRGREFYFDKKNAMESLWSKLRKMGIEPNTSNSFLSEEDDKATQDIVPEQSNFAMGEFTPGKVKESGDWLIKYLTSKGLNPIDKRNKGGGLWVVGGSELKPILEKLTNKDINFEFAPNGSRSTRRQPAWYTKD